MSLLSEKLLGWYRENGRRLPWRNHPDPYAVWVSEIMLQQTRVETVISYFERWMRAFPDVATLAGASQQEVLNLWEGLGYYSRARNLQRAAGVVVEKFDGKLPKRVQELRSLPGIGRYTAGAIASMAFGLDEPTLDGNLRRVFARVFDVHEYADSSAGENLLWKLAAENLPKGLAGDYNQALMDLGAMLCLPKNPRCLLCPLIEMCEARKNGTQELRPVLKPRKSVPHYIQAAAVIHENGRTLLLKRPAEGLLGGMWEFPNVRVEGEPGEELGGLLKKEHQMVVRRIKEMAVIQHAYTHFKVTTHAFLCQALEIPTIHPYSWVKIAELDDYPMGKIDRQIARALGEEVQERDLKGEQK